MSSFRIIACWLALTFASSSAFGQAATEANQADSPAMKASGEAASSEGSSRKHPDAEPFELKLSQGKLVFAVPGDWKQVKARSRILEAELKVAAVGDDSQDGRITIMPAGGSIPANVARWEGQFAQPSGVPTKAETKIETVAEKKVHVVDITGTFQDSMGRGPFAGGQKVARENYRMLAAIIEMESKPDAQYVNNYFFKFIGPKATVDANADGFLKMLKSMKAN